MGISSLHLQFAERFLPLHRGGKIARAGHFGQLGDATQSRAAKSVRVGIPNGLRFGSRENFRETHCLFPIVGDARSRFLVKKIFSPQLKIKFIFFLSLSQWISSLKPAGEGSHKAHVNKL